MSMPELSKGLSEKARQCLIKLFQSGDSQEIAIADFLNDVASNDEESAEDSFLVNCAEQLLDAATAVIKQLSPPTPVVGYTDPYLALIGEATRAAQRLDGIFALRKANQQRLSAEDNTIGLRVAIQGLRDHLRDNVSNTGGRVELHRFPNRPLTPTERMYLEGAKDYQEDGRLEFDDDIVVSEGSDPGAYVLGWQWVYLSELKFPRPFEAEVKYQPQQHDGSPSGEQPLAIDQCLAYTEDEARKIFMDRHWDARLDAAGCVPIVNFVDLAPDLKTWYYCEDPEETEYQIEVKARNAPEALQIIQLMFPDAKLEELADQDWETK